MPYIGLEHIEQGTLSLRGTGVSTNTSSKKYKFEQGDILFGKLRPSFRKLIKIKFKGVCSTDISVLRVNDGVDPSFLFYLLATPEFIGYATKSSTGTKMPRADWNFLRNLYTILPPISTQQKIGSILQTMDNKIESNLRMNDLLEAIIQTYYEWLFVDYKPFKDPSHELNTNFKFDVELNKFIPNVMQVVELKEIGKIITGITPSNKFRDDDSVIPFIKIQDMQNLFVISTESKITKEGMQNQSHRIVPPNSICVSCVGTPGLVSLTTQYSLTNQQINTIIPYNIHDGYYILFKIKSMKNKLINLASGGTTTLNLNKTDFSKIKIELPPEQILYMFNNKVNSFMHQILSNTREILILQKLRDKLISQLFSIDVYVKFTDLE